MLTHECMTFRLSIPILLLAAFQGHAQSTIAPGTIPLILQGMGFQFTETSLGDATAFAFHFNGRPVTLRSEMNTMLLSTCFEEPIEPLQANQWDREHFSTGVRLDHQGCAPFLSSAKFGGRVTNQILEDFIGQFLTGVTLFARFISHAADHPASPIGSPIGPMEWSQFGRNIRSFPPSTDSADSAPGILKINGNISLKYDPDRWTDTGPDGDGRWSLTHSSGDGYALILAERIAVPRGSIEDIVLANAQSLDPHASIVFRQQRRVNGADVRFVKTEADINAVPMFYWGCFYSGEYGTVQLVTYAEEHACLSTRTTSCLPSRRPDDLGSNYSRSSGVTGSRPIHRNAPVR